MQAPGRYEFGDVPPYHLMGVEANIAEWEFDRLVGRPDSPIVSFEDYTSRIRQDELTGELIWKEAQRVLGQHIPTGYQKTGDCVSFGCAHVTDYVSAHELAIGQEEVWRRAFPPWFYGISRCAPDLGAGQLGGGAGSTGAWGAGAMAKYGCLFADDQNVPAYSGGLADQWGRGSGPPREFYEVAVDNKMGITTRLTNVEDIRDLLLRKCPCTIASNRGFKMAPDVVQGHATFIPSGSWSHQMSLIAWMDDPFPAAFRLNSWGPDAHGDPLNDTPRGGAWNRAEDLEKELRSSGVEVFACSQFEGHPGPVDPGIV